MIKLEPLGGFMQVRLLTHVPGKSTSAHGIILPDKAVEKTRIAEVVAIGPGTYNPYNGGRFDSGVRVGDLIYIMQHGPIKIIHHPDFKEEPETFLIGETDVYAVYMRKEEAIKAGLVKSDEEKEAEENRKMLETLEQSL